MEVNHLNTKQEGYIDPDVNWQVENVLGHLESTEDGDIQFFFKVKYLGGEAYWVHMDDLHVHDPVALIKYGNENELLKSAGWE